MGDQLSQGGQALRTGRKDTLGKDAPSVDRAIHEASRTLGLRTPVPVGGARWRIDAEELAAVLKLAVEAAEEIFEGVLLPDDIQEGDLVRGAREFRGEPQAPELGAQELRSFDA